MFEHYLHYIFFLYELAYWNWKSNFLSLDWPQVLESDALPTFWEFGNENSAKAEVVFVEQNFG